MPTGKTAYGDPRQAESYAAANTDSVKDTPQVVSEIFVHSKFLTDITISEKFAIGPTAVNSTAAVATLGNPAAQAVATTNGTVNAGPASVVLPTKVVTQKVPDETLKTRINTAIQEWAQSRSLDDIRRDIYKAVDSAKSPVDYEKLMEGADQGLPRTAEGFSDWLRQVKDAKQLNTVLERAQELPK